MQVFVKFDRVYTLTYRLDSTSISSLKDDIEKNIKVPLEEQLLYTFGGLPCKDGDLIKDHCSAQFTLQIKVCGGKGGFGSLLKSQGDRMATRHTMNVDACRDLSGRRIGVVKAEKKRELIEQMEEERKKKREEAIDKKIKDGLKPIQAQKIRMDDSTFLDEKKQVVDKVKDAVRHAMLKARKDKKKKKQVQSDDDESE